jgi:multidrug resistance efflux pump
MLDISENSIRDRVDMDRLQSWSLVLRLDSTRTIMRFVAAVFAVLLITLFLPWTQNISGQGKVTSLDPSDRPQTINSVIPGRIENWYVNEGDSVNRGDTLVVLSEVKDAYFDPELLERTEEQLDASRSSAESYAEKEKAVGAQYRALTGLLSDRTEQALNRVRQAQQRVTADSTELIAAEVALSIAEKQWSRQKELYDKGLRSLTEFEARDLARQQAIARRTAADARLLVSRADMVNARVELSALRNDMTEKQAKALSELQSATSSRLDAEVKASKLRNDLSNYRIRSGMYAVLAPQDGFVARTAKSGIGEMVKEGEELLVLVPRGAKLAIEMYVDPIDIPLVHAGEKARIIFDGWPAVVFSGWPDASFGTFGAVIVSYDRVISPNGKFRVLLAPDIDDVPWPHAIQQGSGARGMALLNDVPVWYELWRQVNGFPADYYQPQPKTDLK